MSESIRTVPSDLASAYEQNKKLISSVCGCFRRRHGGDYQELVAEANFIFVRCFPKYDKEKASFSTFMSQSIWRGLVDYVRRLYGRGKKKKAQAMGNTPEDAKTRFRHGEDKIPDRHHFDLSRFKLELSDDAQQVVDYTLSPPMNVTAAVRVGTFRGCSFLREIGHFSCLTPEARFSYALGDFLAEMGWSRERVMKSFRELRNAVTG